MTRFAIEMTSNGGEQHTVEAQDEESALREFFAYGSAWNDLLVRYDDETDPRNSYHGRGDPPWKYVKISIGRLPDPCVVPGCDDDAASLDKDDVCFEHVGYRFDRKDLCEACKWEDHDDCSLTDMETLAVAAGGDASKVCTCCTDTLMETLKT